MPESPRWARQSWGDYASRWHLSYTDGRVLCHAAITDGRLYAPRTEWRQTPGVPMRGKVCRYCLRLHETIAHLRNAE